jgi:hypothetical protein
MSTKRATQQTIFRPTNVNETKNKWKGELAPKQRGRQPCNTATIAAESYLVGVGVGIGLRFDSTHLLASAQ